jgi:hypothetical protein
MDLLLVRQLIELLTNGLEFLFQFRQRRCAVFGVFISGHASSVFALSLHRVLSALSNACRISRIGAVEIRADGDTHGDRKDKERNSKS